MAVVPDFDDGVFDDFPFFSEDHADEGVFGFGEFGERKCFVLVSFFGFVLVFFVSGEFLCVGVG